MAGKELIDKLESNGRLSVDEFEELLSGYSTELRDYATSRAYKITRDRFKGEIYPWAVIEVSNFCAHDDYYDASKLPEVPRYRLGKAEVLKRCAVGHAFGFRNFVLEASGDPEYTEDMWEEVIYAVNCKFPDSAITLALGERSREVYQQFFDAGADRYLLRHDAADPELFAKLHPRRTTLAKRVRALEDLASIGYQVGPGMLVGAPFQTDRHLANDLMFLGDFRAKIVTVAPFMPEKTARFRDYPAGPFGKTLFVMSLVRIMLKDALLPIPRGLADSHHRGRELAVMAGANVVLPNLTPLSARRKYAEGVEPHIDNEITERVALTKKRLAAIGYQFSERRGDFVIHDLHHAEPTGRFHRIHPPK